MQFGRLAISLLTISLLIVGAGCGNDSAADKARRHFETLGAVLDVNHRGQVTAIHGHGKITDADLAPAQHFEMLREVRLSNGDFQGPGLASLNKLKNMDTLILREMSITDEIFQHIGKLTTLRVLTFSMCNSLSGIESHQLRDLAELEELTFAYCPVTDEVFPNLTTLASLRVLNLRGTHITDKGLYEVQNLPVLNELYLEPNCYRVDGEFVIGGFMEDGKFFISGQENPENVERLITDEGIAHLHSCRQLEKLDISGAVLLTESGVEALTTALPECECRLLVRGVGVID